MTSLKNPPKGRRGSGRRVPNSNRSPYISNGYVMVYNPDHPNAGKNGYLAEHTVVMSEHIGRPLLKQENVHHKNGNRSDNRIQNLELWSTSQPRGQRVEDKLEWAQEIIALYQDKLA